MNKSIIIAHYKENIEWILNIPTNINIYVYNKSGSIPEFILNRQNIYYEFLDNIGNEQHTYFYHIIKYYNNLDGNLYFTQGNFAEHSFNFLDKIENNVLGGLSDINLITTVFGNNEGNYHRHINHKYDQSLSYEYVKDKIFIDPWNNEEAINNINYIIDILPELNIKKENWIFNANGLYGNSYNNLKKIDLDTFKKCYRSFYDKPKHINMLEFAFERLNQFIILK